MKENQRYGNDDIEASDIGETQESLISIGFRCHFITVLVGIVGAVIEVCKNVVKAFLF